jgi:hypothetical protein
MVPARSSLRPIEAVKIMIVLPHAEALLVAIGKTGSRTGSKRGTSYLLLVHNILPCERNRFAD